MKIAAQNYMYHIIERERLYVTIHRPFWDQVNCPDYYIGVSIMHLWENVRKQII